MSRVGNSGESEINKNNDARKTRTVRLPQEADKAAVDMANELGISVNELLRRALGTERFLIDAQRNGSRILIKNNKDEISEVIMR